MRISSSAHRKTDLFPKWACPWQIVLASTTVLHCVFVLSPSGVWLCCNEMICPTWCAVLRKLAGKPICLTPYSVGIRAPLLHTCFRNWKTAAWAYLPWRVGAIPSRNHVRGFVREKKRGNNTSRLGCPRMLWHWHSSSAKGLIDLFPEWTCPRQIK